MSKSVNIVAAVADNLAIGCGGELLWHIPGDLKYFKKLTMGCPVIMGRKTFRSLGRPLPGRLNIVVSRSLTAGQAPGGKESSPEPRPDGMSDAGGHVTPAGSFPDGVVVAGSLGEAVKQAEDTAAENIFIIGGGEIYRQAMDICGRLYITHVHALPQEADTFFPAIDPSVWEEGFRSESHTDPASGLEYDFSVYVRK